MTTTAHEDQFRPEPHESPAVMAAARRVCAAEEVIWRACGTAALTELRDADHALTMAVRAEMAVRSGS